MTNTEHQSILVIVTKGNKPQYNGISRYAHENNLYLIPLDCVLEGGVLRMSATHEPVDFVKLKGFWNFSGIIVSPDVAHITYALGSKCRVPMVLPDPDTATEELGANVISVSSDPQAVAGAAALELLGMDFENYAFAPAMDAGKSWSIARHDSFKTLILLAGRLFHDWQAAARPAGTTSFIQQTRTWLKWLPKPCGIFAACDIVAEHIRSASLSLGLRIPEDIALVGVDNRIDICEGNDPTITSIEQDLEGCYYRSAQLLHTMIRHPKRKVRSQTFGVLRIVRRASTRPLLVFDVRVKKALEFIRLHAAERIGPAQVVAEMGFRRSFGDQRFRECTGRSILEEISYRRIEMVKDGLRHADICIGDLSSRCGFASAEDMRRVFKKITGLSPREWRKSQ